MKTEYTDHSKIKIAKRGLQKADIEAVLENADRLLDARDGRRIAQKVVGKYLLRVVFEERGQTRKVITAYYAKPERYR